MSNVKDLYKSEQNDKSDGHQIETHFPKSGSHSTRAVIRVIIKSTNRFRPLPGQDPSNKTTLEI